MTPHLPDTSPAGPDVEALETVCPDHQAAHSEACWTAYDLGEEMPSDLADLDAA